MTLRSAILAILFLVLSRPALSGWKLIGWNDLGMHCLDGDYSVYAILPPYNNLHAQLLDSGGALVKSAGGITVTYAAVADPSGSINTTSRAKTNFWQFAQALFGASPALDMGLAGSAMPGASNQPEPMKFDAATAQFVATGIPIIPFDDSFNKNTYPLMRLTARDNGGNVLATTDVVLPVSDEMDCRACHGTTRNHADYKRVILRIHDQKQGSSATFQTALTAAGYRPDGLLATVSAGTPILCARCHLSNALPGTGQAGIPPLTRAVHSFHASVADPVTGLTLDATTNRSACYRCHPGSETRCLRGVMGNAVAADGSMAIQCQNCHGGMSLVGAASRQGWLEEPACQSCHTGTAVQNAGQIRFQTALAGNTARQPAVWTFASSLNTPAAGLSLFRFSSGHGGLQCEACHGSTHAEFPTSQANDNLQSIALQGAAGILSECSACHASVPLTTDGGPHGMHAVGDIWVSAHPDIAEHSGAAACAACHGTDFRGTVLSRVFTPRVLNTRHFGTRQLFQGEQIGCYFCHAGPRSEDANGNTAPAAASRSASAVSGSSVTIPLTATDADGNALTVRIVSQPRGGTVGLNGATATYFSRAGFEGQDAFTFAAWDGSTDSNLATVQVNVTPPSRPSFAASGLLHCATLKSGAVAPGEMFTLSGANLGSKSQAFMELTTAGLAGRILNGTRVLFDGLPAAIIRASDAALTAVVPYGVGGRSSTQIQVEFGGILSPAVPVNVAASVPGVYTEDWSGTGPALALNEDGHANSALIPASSSITFFVTGVGAVTPALADGQIVDAAGAQPAQHLGVTLGGKTATVVSFRAAPYLPPGMFELTVQVPAGLNAGAVPLLVTVGSANSQPGVTVAVK